MNLNLDYCQAIVVGISQWYNLETILMVGKSSSQVTVVSR